MNDCCNLKSLRRVGKHQRTLFSSSMPLILLLFGLSLSSKEACKAPWPSKNLPSHSSLWPPFSLPRTSTAAIKATGGWGGSLQDTLYPNLPSAASGQGPESGAEPIFRAVWGRTRCDWGGYHFGHARSSGSEGKQAVLYPTGIQATPTGNNNWPLLAWPCLSFPS